MTEIETATEAKTRSPLRIWGMRLVKFVLLPILGLILLAIVTIFVLGGGTRLFRLFDKPTGAFEETAKLPAPDYAKPNAWLAYPGRNGLERSTPPGMTAIDEAEAPVDVFFIHPTTFSNNKEWNGPFDADDKAAPLNPVVLMGQASAFNGCCLIYAPRYRQASVAGLKDNRAADLAYRDVAEAFRYFIAHANKGRPFIIASHSQGTGHAIQLLQNEILKTPLKDRLVAAYLIGGYVPEEFAEIGLPVCDGPRQTGCVISWNASKGWKASRMAVDNDKTYPWQGTMRRIGETPAVCVNPLSWRSNGAAPITANQGSLAFPEAPFPAKAATLTKLETGVTGAVCDKGLLVADIPWGAPLWFRDGLSNLLGSYHLNDYGLFYANIRSNAIERVGKWQADHPPSHSGAK